jgi:transposase InsO family protein
MVSPSQRRAVLAWAQHAYQVSERRACRGLAIHRAMIRYRSVKADDAPVRRRLHELAKDRPAFGVRRLHTMLRRDGLVINLKKVRRLYLEEGLQLKPRRRRRRSSTVRQPRAEVSAPHERWAMDFMHDVLATGQQVRVFTLIDVYSRECIALEVARSFSGADVARLLSDAGANRHQRSWTPQRSGTRPNKGGRLEARRSPYSTALRLELPNGWRTPAPVCQVPRPSAARTDRAS